MPKGEINWAERLPAVPASFGPPAGIFCRKLDYYLGMYNALRLGGTVKDIAQQYSISPKSLLGIMTRMRRWTYHPQWYDICYPEKKRRDVRSKKTLKGRPKLRNIK